MIKSEPSRIFDQRFAEESIEVACLYCVVGVGETETHLRSMMIAKVRVSLFFLTLLKVKSEIYLHHTNDGFDSESYDCVLVQSSLVYCRRPKEAVNLARNDDAVSCHDNGGEFHRFSELRSKNISISTILHQWKSSLERVEEYSRYLTDASEPDGDLCQCLHPGQFGRSCEYRLPIGETFEETLEWQLIMRQKNPLDVQRYGDIVCYETLQCNSGVLCLDWREICDGIQNCMSGLDEENCDLLEMNRCNEDEYRCVNGMCVPDHFFLDGEQDCLDWSDEIHLKESEKCPLESASDECDDHLCPLHRWSCGDGQCIEYRLAFQRSTNIYCQSGREQYFICETHVNKRQWTMPNGRCYNPSEDDKKYEEPSAKNLSDAEQCQYLLKCSLSGDAEKGCSCDHDPGCAEKRKKVCSSFPIRYPRGAIAAPFLFFLFNRTMNRRNKLPDALLINGNVQCRYSLITVRERVIPFQEDWNVRQIIEDHFCQPSRRISWTQSRPECHQANDSTDRCGEWNRCLSITRIGDKSIDCINGRDEEKLTSTEIEESCARVRQHRLRCSIGQATCLSLLRIGDGNTDCRNAFDAFWFGIGRRELSSMGCNSGRKDECSLLRQYIDQSWTAVSMNRSDVSSKHRIRFRSYCDSFWDLPGSEDEDRLECQRWWICADDQYRCQTGQCIERRWFDDGEWDCQDASDEHRWLNEMTRGVLSRATIFNFTNRSYSIPSTCPSHSHPFLCLSSNATQPGFSCFNLSQIGDGHIDCAGAFDERNTVEHCSRSSMLGLNFRCLSSNTCIPFTQHCSNGFRCPNRSDDEHWCGREYYQPSDSSDFEAFTCFNGKYLPTPSSRCSGDPDCHFWEDEYMCQFSDVFQQTSFREEKQSFRRIKQHIFPFSAYPPDLNITQLTSDSFPTVQHPRNVSENVSSLSAYWCNRGLGVLSMTNDSIACFCPPQYYGEKCEYHRDRLSVVLLLNRSRSVDSWERESRILLKLVVVFLVDAEVLDRDQFHLQPSFGSQTSKMTTHFLYPRSQRRERFFNRSDLLLRHPFSIRIELYQTRRDEQPSLIALWSYPILFDHLPVFRLAKVLQLGESSTDRNPCSSRPCHRNEQCQPLMNNKSQYICLCKTNFTGENCSRKDPQCDQGYCAVGSLCQPSARGSSGRNSSLPFCLCPFNRYGDRCSIEHDRCLLNPCLHGGSCFPDSQPGRVICLCTKEYSGAQCQWERPSIRLSLSIRVPHRGGVIQYLQIDLISLHLTLVDQQVFRTLPQHLEYFHSDLTTTLPDIVLAKLYSSEEDSIPDLYLLSVHLNLQLFSIRGRTEISPINRCDRLQTFSNGNSFTSLGPLDDFLSEL